MLRTAKECTKKYDVRAQPLFYLLNPLFKQVPVTVVVFFRRRTSRESNGMQVRKILCPPSLAFDSAHVYEVRRLTRALNSQGTQREISSSSAKLSLHSHFAWCREKFAELPYLCAVLVRTSNSRLDIKFVVEEKLSPYLPSRLNQVLPLFIVPVYSLSFPG